MNINATRNKKIEQALDDEAEQTVGTRASSPLNKVAVRRLIRLRLAKKRPALAKKLTRVSEGSVSYLEAKLTNIIDREIDAHPTKGATVRIGGQ